MYKIEHTPYGLKIIMQGTFSAEEGKNFTRDTGAALDKCTPNFGVLRDMSECHPLSPEAEKEMVPVYQLAVKRGLVRQAIIVPSGIMKMQSVRRSKEVGIYNTTRYFDASEDPNWERTALDWVIKGIDPDI
jgi:hypothetical protein